MAIMIPAKPNYFDPLSMEEIMFNSLEKLPDEYFVFHSFRTTQVSDGMLHETETDFLIFNQRKGVVCVEAKAGRVRYENGSWIYQNGKEMRNGGPFFQAQFNKYNLLHLFVSRGLYSITQRCKFLHAVWFPSYYKNQLCHFAAVPGCDTNLILPREALDNPQADIERIFAVEIEKKVETCLSDDDVQIILQNVLCPKCDIAVSSNIDRDIKNIVFHRLLKDQVAILNFLTDQPTVAVNGAAGTGKTLIAVEKARREAFSGKKVLFLCFNNKLKDYLSDTYPNNNISYYTISGYVSKLCGDNELNYAKAASILSHQRDSHSFLYQVVIIDEAQDFGIDTIEQAHIADVLLQIILDHKENGAFFAFYDSLQMVQSKGLPHFLSKLDSRFTLRKNCRNTQNIAKTSMSTFRDKKITMIENSIPGQPTSIYFSEDNKSMISAIDNYIDTLIKEGMNDIVILTCKTEEKSSIASLCVNGMYRDSIYFTTCRKFKGLEADGVILVDLDKQVLVNDVNLFYVGASRARFNLAMFSCISEEDSKEILEKVFNDRKIVEGQCRRKLANKLKVVYKTARKEE